jgi:hypothetical protein
MSEYLFFDYHFPRENRDSCDSHFLIDPCPRKIKCEGCKYPEISKRSKFKGDPKTAEHLFFEYFDRGISWSRLSEYVSFFPNVKSVKFYQNWQRNFDETFEDGLFNFLNKYKLKWLIQNDSQNAYKCSPEFKERLKRAGITTHYIYFTLEKFNSNDININYEYNGEYELTRDFITNLRIFLNGRYPFKYFLLEIVERLPFQEYTPNQLMEFIDDSF